MPHASLLHQQLVKPSKDGSFRQEIKVHVEKNYLYKEYISGHQQLVKPPKGGGSFRQLTSTGRELHTDIESKTTNQKPSATCHTTRGWELQATDNW